MFKIFVGNLTPTTTVDALKTLFSRHAEVEDVAIATNPDTGKPRGFAIIMIRDEQQGKTAIQLLRGSRLNGRALIINQARKRKAAKPTSRRPGPGFRARAGYRGGSGRREQDSTGGRGGYAPRARAFGNRPARRPNDRPDRPQSGDSRE